ncbi:MAG: hypothetical protein ACK4R8_03400 [Thiobacillus sp.]
MAVLGGILIRKHGRRPVWGGGTKTFSLLFLYVWVLIALSVPGSPWLEKSLSTRPTFPRICLAGIYILWMLRE